jgi:hypothetical protein
MGTEGIPIMLEIIPPRARAEAEEKAATARQVAQACARLPVSAISIPEVRDESRNGVRKGRDLPKMAPREFAILLRKAYGEIGAECPEPIVNRCVPYVNVDRQKNWFQRTHDGFGVHSFVLVGGETSGRRYPGPTVPEAARILRSLAFPSLIGGIAIPTRRRPGRPDDEPQRMLGKVRSGIRFFTTQILMEPDSVCRLLRDYSSVCRETGLRPARVFLGIAPVSHRNDIEFMKWLGVEIPRKAEQYLLGKPSGVEKRSLKFAEELVLTVLEAARGYDLECPPGILVEHVMKRNFDLSVELTSWLSRRGNAQATGGKRAVSGGSRKP